MLALLQIVAVLDLAVAMALSLAHALEFPGKARLSRDEYFAVQRIYYPGFSYAGISEVIGILLLAILIPFTARGGAAFGLTVFALLATMAMHATYWLITHPINRAWLEGVDTGKFAAGFFSFGSGRSSDKPDWTQLRDRWEYSHLLRAALAFAAFASLVIALHLSG